MSVELASRKGSTVLLLSLFVILFITLSLAGCGDSSTSGGLPIVDPTFSSSPPPATQEGSAWSYTVAAKDPSGGSVTYALTTSPSGASISGATVTWTPTHAQSRTGNDFVITAKTSEGGSAKQSFTVTPNGSVNGTMIKQAANASGIKDYPVDLSLYTIEALVPNGSGGYDVITGSGDSSGNFSIPNVPAGSFWLHNTFPNEFEPNYVWTNASDIDAGWFNQYRTDGVSEFDLTVNPNISLTVPIKVSSPVGDSIVWTSPDEYIGGGGTSLVGQTFTTPFPQYGFLLDSSQGDRAFLIHYYTNDTPSPGLFVRKAAESIEYDSLTETADHTSVSISGTMSPLDDKTVDPVINIAQFDTLLASQKNGINVKHEIELFDACYDASAGYATGISLLRLSTTSTTDGSDVGSFTYGLVSKNGVPYYVYRDQGERTFTTSNGTYRVQYGIQDYDAGVPTASAALSPVIGLPQSPLVDGADFYSDQSLSTLTPTISWSAPTFGTATYYSVGVLDISGMGPETLSLFYTTSNSVLLPPGTLQAGRTYVVSVTAASDSAVHLATAPFRQGPSAAYGTIVSGAFTTSGSATKTKRAQVNAAKGDVYVTLNKGRMQIERK